MEKPKRKKKAPKVEEKTEDEKNNLEGPEEKGDQVTRVRRTPVIETPPDAVLSFQQLNQEKEEPTPSDATDTQLDSQDQNWWLGFATLLLLCVRATALIIKSMIAI